MAKAGKYDQRVVIVCERQVRSWKSGVAFDTVCRVHDARTAMLSPAMQLAVQNRSTKTGYARCQETLLNLLPVGQIFRFKKGPSGAVARDVSINLSFR
jgi:hypothetical protein